MWYSKSRGTYAGFRCQRRGSHLPYTLLQKSSHTWLMRGFWLHTLNAATLSLFCLQRVETGRKLYIYFFVTGWISMIFCVLLSYYICQKLHSKMLPSFPPNCRPPSAEQSETKSRGPGSPVQAWEGDLSWQVLAKGSDPWWPTQDLCPDGQGCI